MPTPVLFLIEHLSDGGSERHLHDVASLLDTERFPAHVIYFSGGLMSERLDRHPAVRTTQYPVIRKNISPAFVRGARNLAGYIREHGIEIVITFHFLADLLGAAAAACTPRVVLVSSRRDMGFTRSGVQKRLGRLIGGRVDRYIAVSDAVRRALAIQENIPPEKTTVLYNGTDFAKLDSNSWDLDHERRQLGIRSADIVLGCVANFNPVKGHGTLLAAFDQVRRKHPDLPLRLLLAGDGPMRTDIEAEIDRRGMVDQVVLVGHSSNPTREYQLSDIIVSPSDTEGFSNTVVEAMAFARPVVATAVGGTPEAITHAETGLLVEAGDVAGMSGEIGGLLLDPKRREELGVKAAAEARRRFSLETMMARFEDFLTSLAGLRG